MSKLPIAQGILTPDQRVRVFVSSTLSELQAERSCVKKVIEQDLDLYTVMFEAGASPHPPRTRYRAMLLQSHIYLGIFWESYGWVAPDMDISGIEDEYELSSGLTRLVYIKEPSLNRDIRLVNLLSRMEADSSFCYKKFETLDELRNLVKSDIQLVLTESFLLRPSDSNVDIVGNLTPQGSVQVAPQPPNYLKALNAEIKLSPIIVRAEVENDIKKLHLASKVLAVVGDPGIGKSFLLGRIGENFDSIYVSLKGKNSQQVFSYLANQLRLRRGFALQSFPSEEESRNFFESELSETSSPISILIDHADQNYSATQALVSVEPFSNRFIFTTRPTELNLLSGAEKYFVPPFSRSEIEEFLSLRKKDLSPGELERLVSASQGNPLYLDFFVRHTITPLPSGLRGYQSALWSELNSMQKEIVSLCSVSLDPLSTEDYFKILKKDNPISIVDLAELLKDSSSVLHHTEEYWEVFHPFFQEYVVSENNRLGTIKHYHAKLAEIAIEKKRVVSTAYHLLRAQDQRADDFLLHAASVASVQGDWSLAEEFLNKSLEKARMRNDVVEEASILHALSNVYGQSGKRKLARKKADESIRLYEELDDQESKMHVELYASTLWTEQGEALKSISRLEEIINEVRNTDDHFEAAALSNLSYAYLQLGWAEQGTRAAKRAYEIFCKSGIERGEIAALFNLSACIGLTGSYSTTEQIEWAEKLIQKGREVKDKRILAGGLNHLARILRLNNEPQKAQIALQEAISICQNLKIIDAELLNITNLGNAYVDQGLLELAEKAYQEVSLRAREEGLQKIESHAIEMLASVRLKQGLPMVAVQLLNEVIPVFDKLDDFVRTGAANNKLAEAYLELGNKNKAAEAFEYSGVGYERAREWNDAFHNFNQACEIWQELEEPTSFSRCKLSCGRVCLIAEDFSMAKKMFEEGRFTAQVVGEVYLDVLEEFSLAIGGRAFSRFAVEVASYSKINNVDKSYYLSAVNICLNAFIYEQNYFAANALAAILEQGISLLSTTDIVDISERIASEVEHFHARHDTNGMNYWTIGISWPEPLIVQTVCPEEYPNLMLLGLAVSLVILANKSFLYETIKDFGGNKEKSIELQIFLAQDLIKHGIDIPDGEDDMQALILKSNVEWTEKQPPIVLIVDQAYAAKSDWLLNPGTKAFIWILMILFQAIIERTSHQDEDFEGFKGKALEFCNAFFGRI